MTTPHHSPNKLLNLRVLRHPGDYVWDEDEDGIRTPPRAKDDEQPWVMLNADRGYIARTGYQVCEETFAAEDRRRAASGKGAKVPPPGLVCSGRLGSVEKLY